MSEAERLEVVWPLVERWQMGIFPNHEGTWDVQSGYAVGSRAPLYVKAVPFAQIAAAIAAIAVACAAEEAAAGEETR